MIAGSQDITTAGRLIHSGHTETFMSKPIPKNLSILMSKLSPTPVVLTSLFTKLPTLRKIVASGGLLKTAARPISLSILSKMGSSSKRTVPSVTPAIQAKPDGVGCFMSDNYSLC